MGADEVGTLKVARTTEHVFDRYTLYRVVTDYGAAQLL